jgi:hypothetical protein
MAKKKGAKKKGGVKKKKVAAPAAPEAAGAGDAASASDTGAGAAKAKTDTKFYYRPPPRGPIRDDSVDIRVRLDIWDHLEFTIRLPVSAPLYAVREAIVNRHGGAISTLRMFKHSMSKKNEISDLTLSLRAHGIEADADGSPFNIIYDFTPPETKCPLLLSTPADEPVVAPAQPPPKTPAGMNATRRQ